MGINWTPLTAAFYSLSRYCGGGLGRGFFARDARMEEPPPFPSPGEYAVGGKRARSLGIAVVLALLFLVTNSASAATYFVDQANPDANDQNTGTAARPWKTIGHAASEVRAGDRVIIRSGMYREGASIKSSGAPSKPIIFEADSHSRVVITGADLLTKWTKESDGTYSTPWSYVFVGWNPLHAHPDDSYHRLIGRCEQVFEMGYPLRQVLDRKEMARGTFFVDLNAKRLYVHTAEDRDFLTHSAPMEASSRQTIRLPGRLRHHTRLAISLRGQCRAARSSSFFRTTRHDRELHLRENQWRRRDLYGAGHHRPRLYLPRQRTAWIWSRSCSSPSIERLDYYQQQHQGL